MGKYNYKKISFEKVIISSEYTYDFISTKRKAQSVLKLPNSKENGNFFVDGRVFRAPDFDFVKFCLNMKVYGIIKESYFILPAFNYPATYDCKCGFHHAKISVGRQSYMNGAEIESLDLGGLIRVGDFSSISWKITFELTLNIHNYHNVSSYPFKNRNSNKPCSTIDIGSDVWIGRGCRIKSANPGEQISIGNGAIVAADSVVVKDVPPFAIVGGNPAKFIKWRFEPEIIEALERIAWWNWDLEKIYDNFYLFNNPEEFVRQFDSQR